MSKIKTIIGREYQTRVKKKSFIIMSILGPVLFAALMVAPALISQMEDTEVKVIAVSDSTHMFHNYFPETDYIKFTYLPHANIEQHKKDFWQKEYYAILDINTTVINPLNSEKQRHKVHLYSDKAPGLSVQTHISNAMEKYLEKEKLKTYGIQENILRIIKTNIDVEAVKINKDGEEKKSNFTLGMILGYVTAFLIYIVIFVTGTQVMRGVIEEKTSRIVEVIVSSVKPFELMAGKLIGVSLVALTQFAIWIVLSGVLYSVLTPLLMPDTASMGTQQEQVQSLIEATGQMQAEMPTEAMDPSFINEMFGAAQSVNFVGIIIAFLLFFVGGYFLYGSLFAAIGSAVDNEADTQQFMLPITIPMVLAIIMMTNVIQNPEGPIAMWFSMIPFTSPVIMMARIPFGVPVWQVVTSVVLLYGTIVLFVWLAARIYRTGILMYGKKPSWKELWKWIRYSG